MFELFQNSVYEVKLVTTFFAKKSQPIEDALFRKLQVRE
jgi:hypothetical protein